VLSVLPLFLVGVLVKTNLMDRMAEVAVTESTETQVAVTEPTPTPTPAQAPSTPPTPTPATPALAPPMSEQCASLRGFMQELVSYRHQAVPEHVAADLLDIRWRMRKSIQAEIQRRLIRAVYAAPTGITEPDGMRLLEKACNAGTAP
jgi:hypothetical protein